MAEQEPQDVIMQVLFVALIVIGGGIVLFGVLKLALYLFGLIF